MVSGLTTIGKISFWDLGDRILSLLREDGVDRR